MSGFCIIHFFGFPPSKYIKISMEETNLVTTMMLSIMNNLAITTMLSILIKFVITMLFSILSNQVVLPAGTLLARESPIFTLSHPLLLKVKTITIMMAY